MRQDEALETVQQVRRVNRRTTSVLQEFWFPLIVFGLLTMASSPFYYLLDGAGVGIFWLIAAPVGATLTARHYRNRQLETGLETGALPYLITAAAIVVGCFVTGVVGGIEDIEALEQLGPPIVIATGYLVFAFLERSVTVACVSIMLAGLAVAIRALDVSEPFLVTNLALGLVLTVTGLASWESKRGLQ